MIIVLIKLQIFCKIFICQNFYNPNVRFASLVGYVAPSAATLTTMSWTKIAFDLACYGNRFDIKGLLEHMCPKEPVDLEELIAVNWSRIKRYRLGKLTIQDKLKTFVCSKSDLLRMALNVQLLRDRLFKKLIFHPFYFHPYK